jgi:hypothetical protein
MAELVDHVVWAHGFSAHTGRDGDLLGEAVEAECGALGYQVHRVALATVSEGIVEPFSLDGQARQVVDTIRAIRQAEEKPGAVIAAAHSQGALSVARAVMLADEAGLPDEMVVFAPPLTPMTRRLRRPPEDGLVTAWGRPVRMTPEYWASFGQASGVELLAQAAGRVPLRLCVATGDRYLVGQGAEEDELMINSAVSMVFLDSDHNFSTRTRRGEAVSEIADTIFSVYARPA